MLKIRKLFNIYLFASSTQRSEETADGAHALELDDEQEHVEDNTLHRQGHKKAPDARLRHREVVRLVCDVYKQPKKLVVCSIKYD